MIWRIEANRPGSARGPRAAVGGPPTASECAQFPEGRPSSSVRGGPPRTARGPRALPGILILALIALTSALASEPTPPDRREIWIPADQLDSILRKNPKAVLLSREQYEALLRDAKRNAKPAPEAPQRATLTSARYQAQLDGKVVQVVAEFSVNVLSDQWAQVPFDFDGLTLGGLRCDAETALVGGQQSGKASADRGMRLLVRGRGEHKITAEFSIPVRIESGATKIHMKLPQAAASSFAITLPADVTIDCDKPASVKKSAEKTIVTLALSAAEPDFTLSWRASSEAGNRAAVLSQTSTFIYSVDAERVHADLGIVLNAALGKLPATLQIDVPAGAKVLQVEGAEVAKWSLAGNTVTVDLAPGERTAVGFRLFLETPSLDQASKATVALPLPKVAGVGRVTGAFAILGNPAIAIRDIRTDALTIQTEGTFDAAIERNPSFVAACRFLALPESPRIDVSRIAPRFDADLDTFVQFNQDAILIERTIVLREVEGSIFSATITIPSAEEVLSVQRADGSEPDWRLENKKVNVRWSDQLAAGEKRVFKIRSRVEPKNWNQPVSESIAFSLGDARVEGAEKVTGYIALKADPSFRVETEASDGLEPRDGRQTPVQGEFAWFRRQNFALKTKITTRTPELQASVIGYALPMENALDLHAQLDFTILHSGVKKVRIKVPAKFAAQFYFDGPQVAERNLEGDTWSVSFQKEITGTCSLSVTAQIPIERNADDASRFAVEVPVITPLGVSRVNGSWVVEANTDTEITFKTTGMNALDSLLAPALAGYKPRHRVIGVFDYLGSAYSLTLEGVRHEVATIPTTIVDRLELASVVSTSGAGRHHAMYLLRTSGEQFLDVGLPPGSKLWSLSVDDQLVKPVSHRKDTVRVELPAKLESGSSVSVLLLYETGKHEWGGSGSQELIAPKLATRIPVLESRWRVFLPEEVSYRNFSSNLPMKTKVHEPVLASCLLWRLPAKENKLAGIIVPKINWNDATVRDAVDSLRRQTGVDIILHSDEATKQTRITLSLKDIPLTDALRYIANLSNLIVKADAHSVALVPYSEYTEELETKEFKVQPSFLPNAPEDASRKMSAREFLEQQGVPFPPGATAFYLPGARKLILRNTRSNLDLIDQCVDSSKPSSSQEFVFGTAGLLPMKFDLPLTGQPFLFEGFYAPEKVTFSYTDWWSRARRMWIWFVAGGVAFLFAGRRRPWVAMLWGMLVLTFVPLCVAASATTACNALLAGWLVAFVLGRVAAWFVFQPQRVEARAV